MADITAVVLNWQRPANMPRVLDALRTQSADVDIVLVNSAGGNQNTFGVEHVVSLPFNAGPVARLLVASQAATPWVLLQDDDLALGDDELACDAIAASMVHGMVGAFGRQVSETWPHYGAEVYQGEAAIIKTRFLVLPTRFLHGVRMPPERARWADDLWLSLETGRGSPVHWVEGGWRKRLVELPQGSVGIDRRPFHYVRRSQFIRWWMDTWADATTTG